MRGIILVIMVFCAGLPAFAEDGGLNAHHELPFDFDPELAEKMYRERPSIHLTPLRNPNHYLWLYNLIFSKELLAKKSESMKSFSVHLEDSYSLFPHPDKINSALLNQRELQSGAITYVGFWPMSYKYDILSDDVKSRIIRVKIHFKNPKGKDLENFKKRIQEAEDLWNDSRPELDFSYRFLFEVVKDKRQAHYSLNILDKTRGPYSVNWSRRWGPQTIAHELGHMMGLGDEYETLTGKKNCLRISIMCASSSSKILPHHYYFILRRLVDQRKI